MEKQKMTRGLEETHDSALHYQNELDFHLIQTRSQNTHTMENAYGIQHEPNFCFVLCRFTWLCNHVYDACTQNKSQYISNKGNTIKKQELKSKEQSGTTKESTTKIRRERGIRRAEATK